MQTDISRTISLSIDKKNIFNTSNCFKAIVFLHLFVWTFLPTFFRSTLPIDAVEGFVWGNQLEWGYDRNPWLNGWLTRLAFEIGGHNGWMTYLFSQLFIILAFWSVWQLGKKLLSPWCALIAIGLLEAIQYYNLAAVDFNDNVLEIGLWPLLAYLFYQATTRQNLRNWLGVGIIAALALMAKYYTAIFLLSLCIFLLVEPQARKSFKQKNFYIAAITFLCLILPHVIWLFRNHFETIYYALNRVNDNSHSTLWQHVLPTMKFALLQFLNFVGSLILFAPLLTAAWRNKPVSNPSNKDAIFNRRFLWIVGSGTYWLTILIAFITGWQLHILWGMPILSLWGLILLAYLQPQFSKTRLLQFSTLFFISFLGFVIAYCIPMFEQDNNSSSNFPAKAISAQITQLWQQKFHKPIPYIAGDRYLSGYISLYAHYHSPVYIDWNRNLSPWIDEEKLRHEGAVFVQFATYENKFPAAILQRFPNVEVLPKMRFQRPRVGVTEPVDILIGFLPGVD